MNIQSNQHLSALQIQDQFLNSPKKISNQKSSEGYSFQELLDYKTGQLSEDLKFSKHASGRLADRNISLSDEQYKRLSEGTQKAGQKGIKDSLVIVDSLAFIVNVPNHTVITAMDQNEAEENIFTNIDGAVIA